MTVLDIRLYFNTESVFLKYGHVPLSNIEKKYHNQINKYNCKSNASRILIVLVVYSYLLSKR